MFDETSLFEDNSSEEAEFFNTDEEQFSADDIKIDEIINERNGLKKEGSAPYVLYIGLMNDKPLFNESKNIDRVVLSSNPYSENFEGTKMIEMIALCECVPYNQIIDWSIFNDRKLDKKLIEKVNARKESANILVSQYIDAILVETFNYPINCKVYSIYNGRMDSYNDVKMYQTVDEIINKPSTLNESLDFYHNGFKRTQWFE